MAGIFWQGMAASIAFEEWLASIAQFDKAKMHQWFITSL
jgi:hypothetical protein